VQTVTAQSSYAPDTTSSGTHPNTNADAGPNGLDAPLSHTNRTGYAADRNTCNATPSAKTSLRHRKSGVRTKNWGNRTQHI
jgi:hypothetical protein